MFAVMDALLPVSVDGSRYGMTRTGLGKKFTGFKKKKPVPMLPWMGQHVRFPAQWESTRFDLKKAPQVRGVIERFWLDPFLKKANLPWAVRSTKTTTLLSIISYVAEWTPAPMAILFPGQQYPDKSLSEHIYPMLENNPKIARQLPPRHKRNRSAINLRDCRIRLANAGTVSDSSGYPALYIFKFEHEKNEAAKAGGEADASRRIESRCAGYARGAKIMEEGSPTDKSISRAAILLESENVIQFRYVVPCPHCQHHQQLEMEQLKIPRKNDQLDEMTALRGAWYECKECTGRIDSDQRTKMMQAGKWIAPGEYIDIAPAKSRASRKWNLTPACLVTIRFCIRCSSRAGVKSRRNG